MRRLIRKNKIQEAILKVVEANKQNKAATIVVNRTSKAIDEDTTIFINMPQELKEAANHLFQKCDHKGVMLKHEKALNLLPMNHTDAAYLRGNMVACYMQMGLGEHPRAIAECTLALGVSPRDSKALLKRARYYEALNRLDLAYRDVYNVLTIEPNNLTTLELQDSVKMAMDEMSVTVNENDLESLDYELSGESSQMLEVVKRS